MWKQRRSPCHTSCACSVLRVERQSPVTCNHFVLPLPLQVIFDGEEAVDAGGVTKEFFLLLLKELMDPVYGMFTHYPESNLLWFSDKVSQRQSSVSLEAVYLFKTNRHKAHPCVGRGWYAHLIPHDAVILGHGIYLNNLRFMIVMELGVMYSKYQIGWGSCSESLSLSQSRIR